MEDADPDPGGLKWLTNVKTMFDISDGGAANQPKSRVGASFIYSYWCC